MEPKRVPQDELESDPDDDFFDVRHRGEPFTGIGVVDEPKCTGEIRYENGVAHGRCFYRWRDGTPMSEFELKQGRHVGESRSWYADGRLRKYCRHDAPRLEQRWNTEGRLIFEEDEAQGYRRHWYASGVLREERRGEVVAVFAPSGELAFVRERPLEVGELPDLAYRFMDAVMLAELDVLADDEGHQNEVFLYVYTRLTRARADGVALLRRLLTHTNLWVVSRSIHMAARFDVKEVRDLLKLKTRDSRIPEPVHTEYGGRAATYSIAHEAKEALQKLG